MGEERTGSPAGHAGSADLEDADNRRAKYYELTHAGRKQLETASESWRKLVAVVGHVLDLT